MAQTLAQVTALLKERVNPKFKIAYERDDSFAAKIKKSTTALMVSSRNFRQPIQMNPGGTFGYFNPAGGALGLGSASTYNVFELTTVPMRQAIQINLDALDYSDSPEKSVVPSVLKREITQGMEEFMTELDRSLNIADNNGLVCTTTGLSSTTYTASNTRGVQLLRTNNKYAVYDDSGLTTYLGQNTVTSIDYANNTFVVDSALAGSDNTDYFVIDGLVATPTWINTIGYLHKTSGTINGLALATYPNLVTPTVAAGSTSLSIQHWRQLLWNIKKRNPKGTLKNGNWYVYWNGSQEAAYNQIADLITEIHLSPGKQRETVDLIDDTAPTVNGINSMVSPNALRDRIELCNAENWGRINAKDIEFYEDKNGNMFFTPMSTSDGSPTASVLFYIYQYVNYFVYSPGAEGFISGLAIPSGF